MLAAGVALVSGLAGHARDILSAKEDRSRTQRDAVFAFAVRVLGAAILYLSQAVLARWMGGHEYGVFVFVWSWVLVLGGLSALGLAGATVRLLPEYREKGELALARGLARGGRLLALASGTIVAALGLAGLWFFGERLGAPYILPAYLALVCVPLYALEEAQDGIGRGRGWMGIALVPPFILRPLLILMTMVAAHATGLPMTAPIAAAAAIVATWGAAIVQMVLVNRGLEREDSAVGRRYAFGSWLGVSLPLAAVYACELAMQNADVLIISRYMTPADVGIYFAAAKTMSLIMFVHYAVGSAVAARFAALNARDDKAGLKAFAADAANWTFWPSLVCAAAILALARPLLSLFGPDFVSGYPVMLILVLGFLCRSAMGPSDILLNMLGEQRLCALMLGATAAIDVGLNFLLIPPFGLIGAATATATALACGTLMSYFAARRRLGIDVAIWHNLKRS